MYDKIAIGKRIKEIRIKRGETQSQFGEKLLASKGNVATWERGTSIPTTKRLKQIAELGKVSTNFLLNGYEISYEDIEKNIKSDEMKRDIKENLAHFLRHYLYYSTYNSNNEKTGNLLNLFLDQEVNSFEELLDKMYLLVSNDNHNFFLNGVYALLNEKYEKIFVQIYLTQFIYHILIQLALDYPNIYFENLLLQLDDTKKNIEEISLKYEVKKPEGYQERLADFINIEEYQNIFKSIDEIKSNLKSKDIIKNTKK